MLTNDEAQKLYRSALKLARTLGYQDAEDIAQVVVLKRLEGKGQRQKLKYSIQSAYAFLFGDSRFGRHRLRSGLACVEFTSETEIGREDETTLGFRELLSKLEPQDQKIIIQYYELGMTHTEIARELGVDDSLISLKIKKIRKQLFHSIQKPSAEDLPIEEVFIPETEVVVLDETKEWDMNDLFSKFMEVWNKAENVA